jgi:hypothetical protein
MRFEATQTIDGTVDEVERAMMHERYAPFLLQHHGVFLEVQPLERREEDAKIHRKVRYRPRPVISSIGPRSVPPEWFAFVETSVWDKKKKVLAFSNAPVNQGISKMLLNTGTLSLRDARGGKTERTMDGEIRLILPFLLKPMAMVGERMIKAEGLKILEGELPVLNRFIAEVLRG